MNYKETLNWLDTRKIIMGEYSTKNIKKLLEEFNSPQDKINTIHITGTNGKGSVVNFLEYTFRYNNFKTAKFTSPYITNIRQSIEINNEYIPESDFSIIATELKPIVEKIEPDYYVSDFEILFAIAILYFSKNNVDIAIVEVGMGGRTDATNVFKSPLATVFTSISLDHSSILGNTISEIAKEKSGIMKFNIPSFSYPQKKEAEIVLNEESKKINSKLYTFKKEDVSIKNKNIFGSLFTFKDYTDINIGLLGSHQVYNASLALLIVDYFKEKFNLKDKLIYKAFNDAKNIGRLEILSKSPYFVIDGAHNKDAIDNLIESIKYFKYNKLILGFSLLKDKDHSYILKRIEKISDKIVLTEIDSDRKSSLDSLYDEFKSFSNKEIYAFKDRKKALEKTLILSDKDDLILWCGSLYLIKDIRALYKKEIVSEF